MIRNARDLQPNFNYYNILTNKFEIDHIFNVFNTKNFEKQLRVNQVCRPLGADSTSLYISKIDGRSPTKISTPRCHRKMYMIGRWTKSKICSGLYFFQFLTFWMWKKNSGVWWKALGCTKLIFSVLTFHETLAPAISSRVHG